MFDKIRSNVFKIASRSPNYIKRFGFYNGFNLLFKVETQKPVKSSEIIRYKVPGYEDPIYLRNTIGDHSIFWQCITQVQYEFKNFPQSKELFRVYDQSIKDNKKLLIIDCGANIGLSVLWFANKFPEAIIYAIEPDSNNFEMLLKNTEHLGNRVKCLEGAVWDEVKALKIINPSDGSASFRVHAVDSNSSSQLKSYTIDTICNISEIKNPFIVKIDIEGGQKVLFKSNTNWVENTYLITLELDDWLLPWQGTSRPFFSCLSQYPFDYLLGGESIFCFRDFSSNHD